MDKRHTILSLCVALLLLFCGCARQDVNQLMQQAYAAAQRGDLGEAEQLTTQCLQANANYLDAKLLNEYCRFSRHSQESDRKQALYNLSKCTIVAPDNLNCWLFYGWALVEAGQTREAIAALKRAEALLPPKGGPRAQIQLLLGRCYVENNLQKEALAILQPLQVKMPYREWPELYNSLGMLALKRRQNDHAIRFLQEGLRHAPGNDVLLRNLAVIYDVYVNDPVQARHYYMECLRRARDRRDDAMMQRLGKRLGQLGRQIGKKK